MTNLEVLWDCINRYFHCYVVLITLFKTFVAHQDKFFINVSTRTCLLKVTFIIKTKNRCQIDISYYLLYFTFPSGQVTLFRHPSNIQKGFCVPYLVQYTSSLSRLVSIKNIPVFQSSFNQRSYLSIFWYSRLSSWCIFSSTWTIMYRVRTLTTARVWGTGSTNQ